MVLLFPLRCAATGALIQCLVETLPVAAAFSDCCSRPCCCSSSSCCCDCHLQTQLVLSRSRRETCGCRCPTSESAAAAATAVAAAFAAAALLAWASRCFLWCSCCCRFRRAAHRTFRRNSKSGCSTSSFIAASTSRNNGNRSNTIGSTTAVRQFRLPPLWPSVSQGSGSNKCQQQQ